MTFGGPEIALPRFAGPLDLLLELVRKQEIEITDIPIAEITRQYLEYLDQAERLDIGLSSEFTYMAATLIHIKARCLLPRDPEIAAREEDPRQELVRQLMDHQAVRQAAEFLQQKLKVNEETWSRAARDAFFDTSTLGTFSEDAGTVNLIQILELAKRALDTARTYQQVVPRESVCIEQMMHWLFDQFKDNARLILGPLLAEQSDADHRISLFLAMLELTREAQIAVDQGECFGPIVLEDRRLHDSNGTTAP
jgi:segregation and condensation protein A